MLGKRGRAAIQRTSSIACMSNRFNTNISSSNNADHVNMINEQSMVKRADHQQGLAANCKAKSGANPVGAGANIPQIIGFHPVNYSANHSAQADQLNHAQQQQQHHMIMINPKGPGNPVNMQFNDVNYSCGSKVQQLQQPLMGKTKVTSAAGPVNLKPTANYAPRSALQTLLVAARQVHMDITEGMGSIKGTTVGNPLLEACLVRQNMGEEEDDDEDENDDDEEELEEEEESMESFLCYDNSTQEMDLALDLIPGEDWLPIDLRMGTAVQGTMEDPEGLIGRPDPAMVDVGRGPLRVAGRNDEADGDCFKKSSAGDEGKGLVLYLATPPAFNNIMSPVISTPAAKSTIRSSSSSIRASFLDACFLCKRPLGQELDIFIYRGDTAFCSAECRYQQMLMEERQQIISHDRPHHHHHHNNHRPNPHYPKQTQFCSMANEPIRHARTAAAAR